jgi:hypothetical protein
LVLQFEDARRDCFADAVKIRIGSVAIIEERVPVVFGIGAGAAYNAKRQRKRDGRKP